MNEEQKQRMTHELGQWNAAMKSSCSASDLLAISTRMAALLHDLIDAPEPEQPNQSEQHLEMVKRDLFQARQALLNEGQQRDALLAALTEIAELDILKYHHAYAIAKGAIEEIEALK